MGDFIFVIKSIPLCNHSKGGDVCGLHMINESATWNTSLKKWGGITVRYIEIKFIEHVLYNIHFYITF